MKYLLDTSIISQDEKSRPNPKVNRWLEEVQEADLYLCDITVAELWYGVQLMPSGKRRSAIQEWLEVDLSDRFYERILSFDLRSAAVYGSIMAQAKKRGHNPGVLDGMIAAIAIANGMTIATLNRKDFERLGAPLMPF